MFPREFKKIKIYKIGYRSISPCSQGLVIIIIIIIIK